MFFDNMLIATEQVAILYLIAAVGFIGDKTGLYTESTAKKCTGLLLYIVGPAKIIESFYTLEYSKEAIKGLFVAIGFGLIMHSIASLVVIPLFAKSPKEKKSVYKFACMYGNCGFMGLPLVDAILGSEGVFYCSAVIISFQIFCFTHGVFLMTKDGEKNASKIDLKKIVVNPGVIPVIIGLPIFLFSINLPYVVSSSISSVASLNSPLAMLIFGTYLANTDFKSVFKDWRILTVSLFKLIAMPLVMISLLRFVGLTGILATTMAITASVPTANNTVIFAAKYNQDAGLASRTVAVVSLLSILTLPLMIAFSGIVL